MTGNLKGALIGGLTGAAFGAVGDKFSGLANVAGHGAVGCVSSVANGGGCGAGALSAGAGSIWSNYGAKFESFAANLTSYAVVGGTASVLGGGKFQNGAVTASYGYLFNCLAHDCLKHYMKGSRAPLDASFDELGAEGVRAEAFPGFKKLVGSGLENGTYSVSDKRGWQTTSTNAKLAYGRVVLQLDGNLTVSQGQYSFSGRVTALPDLYDFDPQPWGVRSIPGEVSTEAGARLPGKPFYNVFKGGRQVDSNGVVRP